MSRLFDNPAAVIMAGGSFLLLLVAVTVLVSLMFRSSRRAAENERARAERHDLGLDHGEDQPSPR